MSHSTMSDTFLPTFVRPYISFGTEIDTSDKLSANEDSHIFSLFSFFYMLPPRIVLPNLYYVNVLEFKNPK